MSTNSDIPDDLYYLDENFSVRSLRKFQLKEILSAHNIPYFNGNTRPDLINLFKKNIEARRDEILMEYQQNKLDKEESKSTKELGRGHRVTSKPSFFSEDQSILSTRRQKRTPATRKPLAKKDKDGYAIPAIPINRKQEMPSFNPEDSFDDEDDHPIVASPSVLIETPKSRKPSIINNNSSNNNRGNKQVRLSRKPIVSPGSKLPKRAKAGPPRFNPEDSFASSGDDNNDDEYYDDGDVSDEDTSKPIVPPEHNVVENKKVTFNVDEDDDDPDYQADEDISDEDDDEELGQIDKEELVQLYKDQAVPPEQFTASEYSILTRSQTMAAAKDNMLFWKARIRQIGYVLCGIYMFFALTCLGITAYARQKNGYCQSYPNIITEKPAPSSIFSLLPSPCIPCPDHGTCVGGELTCDTLYERKTPLYNIGHMFPIADDCIHNSMLGKYVARVERKIKNKLAVHQGESACKHLLAHADEEQAEPAPIVRVLVKDILSDLKDTIQPFLPADKADEIMVIALAAVLEDPKIHYWEVDGDRYLGTEHVEYSAKCQLQRLYKKTPFNVKMMILTFISVVSAFIGASRDYKRNKMHRNKIDTLVKNTTERLMKQYENHLKDPVQFPSAAISVSQIRSSIVDINDSKTIKDWQSVVEKIESHPHIRKSFQEVRGDPVEYWELTV